MKQWAWVIMALALSACGPSSPDDAQARRVLENVRTGQLDEVTHEASPEQLQTPAFSDQLLLTSARFPGYPPDSVTLADVQEATTQGQRTTTLTYDYHYADETVPAQVILAQAGAQAQVVSISLGDPVPVQGLAHFFRHLSGWVWGILGALGVAGVGAGWWRHRARQQRRREEQARRERHERRRRRRERRKRAEAAAKDENP